MSLLQFARKLKQQGVNKQLRGAYRQRLILDHDQFYGCGYPKS